MPYSKCIEAMKLFMFLCYPCTDLQHAELHVLLISRAGGSHKFMYYFMQGYAANLVTKYLHQQAIFSFWFLNNFK
jgi:hypothetical protein